MKKMAKKIWICCEKETLLQELVAGATALGSVSVVATGTLKCLDEVIAAGADTIYQIDRPEGRMAEECLDTLALLIEQEKPDVCLFGATLCGRALAGRLAARLDTAVLADAKELVEEDGRILAANMVYGGGANLVQAVKGPLTLVILGFGVLEKPAALTAGAGKLSAVPFVEPAWSIRLAGEEVRPSVSVNLSAAKRIVSFGLGVSQKEDIPQIQALADALGAGLGCSRPVAEGLGWMPKECYMGISGVFTKADIYLAVGISGQVQHMVGVKDAKLIAVINKDANAPIMKQCDYAIVGNLYDIIPALVRRLLQ